LSKKTVAAIIESNNDYLIGVKKNQKKLHNRIQELTQNNTACISRHTTFELNRKRLERRYVMVYENLEGIDEQWVGLSQIVKVYRNGERKKKKYEETAYYITSKPMHAMMASQCIRLHWSIENSLHYVKDVTMKEDSSKIRSQNAPANMALIRNLALNCIRTTEYKNVAQAKRMLAHDIQAITELLI